MKMMVAFASLTRSHLIDSVCARITARLRAANSQYVVLRSAACVHFYCLVQVAQLYDFTRLNTCFC